MHLRSLLLASLLGVGCAARMPGPLAVVGRALPARPDAPEPASSEPSAPREEPRETPKAAAAPAPAPDLDALRARIAGEGLWHLQTTPPLDRNDCSGLVMSVYQRAGVPLEGSSESMWEEAFAEGRVHLNKRPEPGDIAFFDNTYDKNRNKRVDDPLSHVALVLSVDPDGTIHMVHNSAGKPIRALVMNLEEPELARKGDKQLNDYLRALDYGKDSDPRLSGQLWRGFAAPPGVEPPRKRGAPKPEVGATAPARAAKPSQLAPSHPLVEEVLAGRRIRDAELDGLDCEALWQLRNTAFARHGYTFKVGYASTWFKAQPWYEPDPKVAYATIGDHMTRADRKTVAKVQAREEVKSCQVPRRG